MDKNKPFKLYDATCEIMFNSFFPETSMENNRKLPSSRGRHPLSHIPSSNTDVPKMPGEIPRIIQSSMFNLTGLLTRKNSKQAALDARHFEAQKPNPVRHSFFRAFETQDNRTVRRSNEACRVLVFNRLEF